MNRTTLSVRRYRKHGYEIRKESVTHGGEPAVDVSSAYTFHGEYIGDPKTAYRICVKLGIRPQPIDDTHNVCTIGFSVKDGKWYGWSHRAIHGFFIGDTYSGVKIKTLGAAKEAAISFAKDVS